MRDNLVFVVKTEDIYEDTAAVQEFLQRKYNLDYEIPFERVHRMGKLNEFNEHLVKSLPNLPTLKTENSSEFELPKGSKDPECG